MADALTPPSVLDELAIHPRGEDLARLGHAVAVAAADERRRNLAEGLAGAVEGAGRAGSGSSPQRIGWGGA